MARAHHDIVVYGSAPWDSPWLTEHNLAHALGRDHRVLFVSPARTLLSPFRYGLRRESSRELAQMVTSRVRRGSTVNVLGPLALPPATDVRAQRLSAPLVRRQVGSALGRLGMEPDVVVTARGLYEGLPAIGRPFVVSLVKDWLQSGGHLTGLDAARVRSRELDTWRRADLVCAVSTRLVDRLAEDRVDSVLLRHGFNADLAPRYGDPAPAELSRLARPLLGCTGRVDGRWAFDSLGALADSHPEGSLVFVGPVNPRSARGPLDAVLARPNVHLFPAVEAAALPAWTAQFDCCLIPYTNDDWQRHASPLKVWDYLYAGAPIAASGAPALGEFPPGLVHFSLDPAQLPELVDAALAEDRATSAQARRRYALENTWHDRATELLELIAARRER